MAGYWGVRLRRETAGAIFMRFESQPIKSTLSEGGRGWLETPIVVKSNPALSWMLMSVAPGGGLMQPRRIHRRGMGAE